MRYAGTVREGLDRIFGRGTVAGLTEGGLLDRFVSEAAPKAKGPIPSYTRWGDIIIATTSEGDKVGLYYTKTNETKSVRLSDPKEGRLKVTPIFGNQSVALQIQGQKVTRIAVFNFPDSTWYTQDLREPVTSAVPLVGLTTVSYTIGHRIYTFSTQAKVWSVLELPKGAVPRIEVGIGSTSFEHDGHIYTYEPKTCKWTDFDTRTILNEIAK